MSSTYENSEEWLLWSFEKLFFFEFFLRNIKLDSEQKSEYDKLKQLPSKIEEKAEDLLTGVRLSGAYPTHGDIIGFVLNYLQLGKLPDLNEIGLDGSDEVEKIIFDLCKHFKSNCDIKLKSDFYTFSQLVNENNIVDIIWWWDSIRNSEIRKEDNLEGRFGTTGRTVQYNNGKEEKTIILYEFPFNEPNSIRYAKITRNNYSIFEATENTSYEITDFSSLATHAFDKVVIQYCRH